MVLYREDGEDCAAVVVGVVGERPDGTNIGDGMIVDLYVLPRWRESGTDEERKARGGSTVAGFVASSVLPGDGDGHWRWPPRAA